MTRFLYPLAAFFAGLLLMLVAAQPTVAQPSPREAGQEGLPDPTRDLGKVEVDWANVEMIEDRESYRPETVAPQPEAPEEPDDAVPATPPDTSTAPAPPPASTPAAPTQTPGPEAVTYVVRSGDTLYELARRFGVPLQQLIDANDIADPRRLEIGQVLVIGSAEGAVTANVTPENVEPPAAGQTYVVQRGDTPFEIARRFGVDVDDLIATNQIADPRRLAVGQVLTIREESDVPVVKATPVSAPLAVAPAAPGSAGLYTVRRGDTLLKIGRRFGVTVQALIAANNIDTPDRIMAGQTLNIPGTTAKSPPEAQPTATATTPAPTEAATNPPPAVSLFIWPVPMAEGWIPRNFQYGHRAIDVILPTGTPIRAAAGGVVEFSGWNAYGYGNLTVIDHGDGYRTLYAHQSERLVESGTSVAQGDIIGFVGSTGDSTDPHLHLELVIDYETVDPCNYLPGGCPQ